MRKLASCQRIKELNPIPDSDNIEVATVLGWKVVVKKGDFKVGDLCAFFEVDSILPDIEAFEFMRPRGFRVRTIKLRGQVSQGLAIPMKFVANEGDDLTHVFGVTQHVIPEPTGPMKAKGIFPFFIPKTDEERVQSNPYLMVPGLYCVTEKVDGSSITTFIHEGEIGVCSRNMWLREDDESQFTQTVNNSGILDVIEKHGVSNFAFQGELVGPGIQKNRLNLKERKILWYNGYDIKQQFYVNQQSFFELMLDAGQNIVPVLFGEYEITESTTIDELEALADRNSIFGDFPAEGVVFRNLDRENLSFKVINKNYLLKHNL